MFKREKLDFKLKARKKRKMKMGKIDILELSIIRMILCATRSYYIFIIVPKGFARV